MKSTEYLYDLNFESLSKMKYFDGLQYKLNCAKKLYASLYKNDIEHERQFYVHKAIKHTERLLREKEEWGT